MFCYILLMHNRLVNWASWKFKGCL